MTQQVKNLSLMQETQEMRVWSLGQENPLEEETWRQPTPVFFPGKSYGQRSLAGYSPKGHKESDMTEHNIIVILMGIRILFHKIELRMK